MVMAGVVIMLVTSARVWKIVDQKLFLLFISLLAKKQLSSQLFFSMHFIFRAYNVLIIFPVLLLTFSFLFFFFCVEEMVWITFSIKQKRNYSAGLKQNHCHKKCMFKLCTQNAEYNYVTQKSAVGENIWHQKKEKKKRKVTSRGHLEMLHFHH